MERYIAINIAEQIRSGRLPDGYEDTLDAEEHQMVSEAMSDLEVFDTESRRKKCTD